MAKAKMYNNFVEVVGNVARIIMKSEKTGELRFTIATDHKYEKKDHTKATETHFLNVLVRPGRKYADQSVVEKGNFLRIVGHLENNSYKAADETWKGGMEINADKITFYPKKEAAAEPAA